MSPEGDSLLPAGSSESGGVLQRQQPDDVSESGRVFRAGSPDAHAGVVAGRYDGPWIRGPGGVRGRSRRT